MSRKFREITGNKWQHPEESKAPKNNKTKNRTNYSRCDFFKKKTPLIKFVDNNESYM